MQHVINNNTCCFITKIRKISVKMTVRWRLLFFASALPDEKSFVSRSFFLLAATVDVPLRIYLKASKA